MTTENPVTSQEALARFKETHPNLNTVKKIAEFSDAQTIEEKEEKFVQLYGQVLSGGDREARQIYRTAVNLQERAVLLWGNIKDAVSPYLKQTLFNNLPQDLPAAFIEQQESIPGYNRLFGNLDFIECEHYRSIFGPAAYFVDLMRFVEQNITQKNSEIPRWCSLEERRPDLARIQLDADNTGDLIPYIDLVNELLEAFVKTVEVADGNAYEVVKAEIFPMSLPFNLPLAEIRSYLKQLKTSLHQIYQIFKPLDDQDHSTIKRLLTQEFLALSPEEFGLIVSEISQTGDLSKHYGGVSLTGSDGLENVDVFLAQTGLTRQQLNELLFQNLDRHEVNAGLSRLFFVNNVSDGLGYLTIAPNTDDPDHPFDQLINLSPQKLDRIYRFIRLARKLDWSFADLDWALRSQAPPYIAETALLFDGINDYVACGAVQKTDPPFTVEAWINPSRAGRHVILSKGSRADRQLHFMVWIDEDDNRLAFYGGRATGDPFKMKSVYPIPTDAFTQVAVVVTEQTVRFYINGRPDQGDTLTQPLAAVGEDLNIGGGLAGGFFAGVIKEVRIWNIALTHDEISDNRYRRFPGQTENLIGYWPLIETVDGILTDLSGQDKHGRLGGEEFVTQPRWVRRDLVLDPPPQQQTSVESPQDYTPQPVTAARPPLPEPPIATRETVLDLDGDNDVLVIKNEKNWGLGRLDRWTLEFWFNVTNRKKLVNRKQVLFTQGDAEAGLSIYLSKQRLYVMQWCNNYERKDLGSSLLEQRTPITFGPWHHLAITHDEFPATDIPLSLDVVEFRAFLDGTPLISADNAAVATGFRLSPVGAVCLGGLAKGMITRFDDAYSEPGKEDQHFFAGQISELRLWRTVKSAAELMRGRIMAPTIAPDLLAYLPLDEGDGWFVSDWAGKQHGNRFMGTLQQRQITLQTTHSDTELGNIYSHYGRPEALAWKDYFYAGRLRIVQNNDAVGVTFLSRHPDGTDQYYLLGRDAEHPTFHLVSHPAGVQTLKSADPAGDKTVTTIQPQANVWHHFLIRVEDTGTRTAIQAKIWPAGETEPADFQIEAYDDNPDIRITSGTVGVWTAGSSTLPRQFDNLCVWPTSIANPTPADLWLDINFEAQSQLPEPEHWRDTGDRIIPLGDKRLFSQIEIDDNSGRVVWGTDATLVNIHAHYQSPDVDTLTWQDYTYEGQMRITDADSGIGVTVFSRYHEDIDQYYSLRRDADHPTFHLTAHPDGVQPIRSLGPQDQTDSGIEPVPNIWYRFYIQVMSEPAEKRTEIRAKLWEVGTLEPPAFQMVVYDDSSIRLRSGMVGMWATGPGSKYFDQLRVIQDLLLSESFETYAPDQDPLNWRDTGKNNSREEDPTLFQTAQIDNTPAFGTLSTDTNIHSHYVAPGVLDWANYIYTGRLYITDSDAGIGVTFLSRYADETIEAGEHDYYYRLRCYSKNPTFHISPHRGHGKTPDELIKGRADSGINPTSNTWYRFRIEVEDTGTRTRIRANVWPDTLPEPTGFQIDAYDDADDRLTAGTVGIWALGKGAKYFDNLQVFQGLLLSTGVSSGDWTDAPSRDRNEPNDTLFKAIDTQDNLLQWTTLNTFPLLRHPLSQTALQFDGQRQSLAGVLEPSLSLTDFTIEAWVKPDQARPNPILNIGGSSNDGTPNNTALEFGLTPQGQPTFIAAGAALTGADQISPDQFVHVAVRVQGPDVTLLVDGQADTTPLSLSAPIDLQITGIEMGRSGETSPRNFAGQYFAGQIKEVRLWNTARTVEQIAAGRYQRPEASAALIGYWSLGEDSPDQIPLTPILPDVPAPIGIDLPDTGFWRAQRQILTFDGRQSVQSADPNSPADRHQRTIEIWFQVLDKTVAQRKQVIYHEGDGQRGLLLYVYDSELYFVGYNTPANESRWQITHEENWQINPVDLRRVWRLKTDRIESGRWHHAAIVLDGRNELRPTSLRGYLDGKLVVAGPGSKLWQHKTDFCLGGVRGAIQFHDGQSYEGASTGTPEHTLNGGILQVRLWNRACTAREIEDSWSRDLDLKAPQQDLDLLWNLDGATGTQILDTSGRDRGGNFECPEQLQTLRQSLQALPLYALTPVRLDETALGRIADIKRLKEDHKLSIDQVTALWSSLKHVGREDGIPFFDRVFNPQGVQTERWNYHLDRPVRWDRTGQENRNRDRQTRSRLMESLQVSSQDLDALVTYLSGAETILELDTAYLTRLYRLARLPRLLRLTVPEFLVLLTAMNQSHKNQASIETLADVLALSDRAAWMQRTGISVAELIFFSKAVATEHADLYAETDLRNLAKQLREQVGDILVSGESFTTTEITEAQSLAIFQFLQDDGWVEVINAAELGGLSTIQKQVQARAAVKTGPAASDLSGLLRHLAATENWMGEFDTLKAELDGLRAGLGNQVLAKLIDKGLMTNSGLVYRQQPDSFSDENLLQVLPGRDRKNAAVLAKRARVRGWLEQRVARQDQIASTVDATLTRLREAMHEAILQGLADMFEISADLVDIVVGYLNSQSRENAVDAVAFIRQIHTLEAAGAPIPHSLSVYFARLVKLLYLLAKFELNVAEARTFLTHPEYLLMPARASSSLALPDLLQPSLANLDRLAHFQQLKTAFNDETGQLIGVLGLGAIDLPALSANNPKVRQLSDLTGWEPRQLITLADALGGRNHNQVEVLSRLQRCFVLAQSMGSDVDFLIQLSGTDQLDYAFYRQQATALLRVLRAKYSEDDWAKVYKPIRNQLAVQRRAALLALAMQQLPDDFAGRQDPNILYEYFLLDMQMGSEVETSRIVQATAGLQLYVQRCRMNLEAGVDPDTISLREWEWVKNYRVWEANRKVFLYPENYIEPELRRTKTPLFEELEQNLLQADINQAAVEKAYITYLDKFSELAKLKIVGSYLHRELAGDPHPGDETLYLVGRTDTQPRIYYLRRHVKTAQGERWLPWEKIDVAINSDFATPVYAFGKLLLFWTEFTKLKESQDRRLSQQIRDKYSTDVINDVFKSPQITDDDSSKIEQLAQHVGRLDGILSLNSNFSLLASLKPDSTHFNYLEIDILTAKAGVRLGFITSSLEQFSRSVARAVKETRARLALVAALSREEITRLERQEWTIDSEGYLFDNRMVGRVQKNADVYKTAVKYSYYNFGKTWIPPQTHLEKQLSETEYQQIKWHSLYAQRAYRFEPDKVSQPPQKESDPKVLEIDENTQLAVVLPRFNMEQLTGSFWLKLVNVSPQGHKGSIAPDLQDPLKDRTAVTQEELTQSLTLLNYDNGSLQITATNNVTAIPGAQTREDNVRDAVEHTQEALKLSNKNNFKGASGELAKIKTIPIAEIAEAINKTAVAIKAQEDATAARTEATKAREAATAASADSPDKKALEDSATQKENSATQKEQAVPARQREAEAAIQAAHTASQDQLLIEVEQPKWESKTLTLTVQLDDPNETLTATLAMDAWQHVALIFEKKVENGVDGYQVKLIQYQQDNMAEKETIKFLKSVRLAQRELLEIGRQTAANTIFSTQMAEFRLWSKLRPKATIQSERLHRKASEAGLFSLPLNAQVPSSNMTLVSAQELTFTIPIAFKGELSSHLAADRERIIIFYGDKIKSIRNNLEEQSFNLTLDRQTTLKNYDVSLNSHSPTEVVLSLTQTDGLFVNDFASTDDTSILALPESTTDTQNFIIRKLQSREVSFLDIHNRPGWYIVDTGDDQLLVKAIFLDASGQELPVLTAAELMQVQFDNAANTSNSGAQTISISFGLQGTQAPVVAAVNKVEFQFERLSTYAIHQLSQNLFTGGIDKFLSPASQKTKEIDFWQAYAPTEKYVPRGRNQIPAEIDFQGSYRRYYEEIFFHIPFLIANQLNANQQFADAQKWYHYIFNPTAKASNPTSPLFEFKGDSRFITALNKGGLLEDELLRKEFQTHGRSLTDKAKVRVEEAGSRWKIYDDSTQYLILSEDPTLKVYLAADRYWQYLPFQNRTAKGLLDVLTQEEALTVYREDPFDPHAIAALRLTTYQKAIVMKYIDNLVDWGDSLFTQDTRESITEATMLYVLAFNLLGPRPTAKPVKHLEEIGTYNDFVENYEDAIEFLTEIEKTIPTGSGSAISLSPHSHLLTHFCVPENEKFMGYWDLVEDRLYKIRHSLNIEGIFRQLALFQPPIDPAALVRAVAGGGGIGGALADLNVSVPHYRYSQVLEQAKDVISMVNDLGSALLSALEAKDDERLTLLQHTHERNLLNLITTLKEYELSEAKEEIEALKINRKNIAARQEYYRGLVEDGTAGLSLNAAEAFAITFKNIIRGLKPGISITKLMAHLSKVFPQVIAGVSGFGASPVFKTSLGGDNVAAAFEAQGAAVELTADVLDIAAEMSQEIGAYQRRYQEWQQENRTAGFDLQEIDQQLAVAKIRLQRTEFDQTIHEKELQQNQEVADFYRTKFTNIELRSWMAGRLSGLYFQAYKLAYDLAKAAEKALQFELPTSQTFITPGHWDSLKKGLLAGESLMLELNRMDKIHLDQDSRFQDIEKTISMKRTFPEALEILKQTGVCELPLSERLFNLDFPGHYCRLVKTIAISIVADGKIDPYDAVHATLSQTGNKTLLVPDSDAAGYLMGLGDEQPDTGTLRVNWRANQQIAISKPSEDLGMFNLDFVFDDRYFPFEGTGAVSTWRLEMPPENNLALVNRKTTQLRITDVIIHLRYTAKSDSGKFKEDVKDLIEAM